MLDILNNLTTETKQSYLKTKEDIKNFLYDPNFLLNCILLYSKTNKKSKNEIIKNNIKAIKQMLKDKTNNSEEEIEYLEKVLKQEFWEDYFLDKQEIINSLGIKLKLIKDDKKSINSKYYNYLIDYVLEENTTKSREKQIIKYYRELIDIYGEIYNFIVINYIQTEKNYEEKTIKDFIFLYRTTGKQKTIINEEINKIINVLTDEQIGVLLSLLDIKTRIYKLIDLIENETKEKTIINEQLTLPLEYNETAILTDTALINNYSVTPLDKRTIEDLQVIKNYDFELDKESTEESEEELNKLTEFDRFVLDTIVITLFNKQNKIIFTDRQIAELYQNKNGIQNPSQDIQKEVNESIVKLQNTRVKLNYNSVQQLKKRNIKVKRNNPLIWLENIEIEKDSSSNYYKIISTPFYYTYLAQTNSNLIEYKRELLYMNIKGVDKSRHNQDLRHYLIRRIAHIKELKTNIYISISDIYQVQDIKADNYNNDSNLRKARFKARERTELILKELEKEYNFTYSQDNKGKIIKGYYIYPKTNN